MCIAILNKTEILSKDILKTSWLNNSDGAGIVFTDGKKLQTFKELNSFDVFYRKYLDVRKQTNFPIVLHFRIATSGKINEQNCHPFNVNNQLAFVHNGVIEIDHCKNYSDTYYFNLLLSSLPNNFLNSEGIKELIAGYIGYSKLIFLNNAGEYTLINEDLGHWDKFGNWYSNHSYESSKVKKSSKEQHTFDLSRYYENKYTFDEIRDKDEFFTSCECCMYENATVFNTDYNADLCEECNKMYLNN